MVNHAKALKGNRDGQQSRFDESALGARPSSDVTANLSHSTPAGESLTICVNGDAVPVHAMLARIGAQ
jgi:hypothetical protein